MSFDKEYRDSVAMFYYGIDLGLKMGGVHPCEIVDRQKVLRAKCRNFYQRRKISNSLSKESITGMEQLISDILGGDTC